MAVRCRRRIARRAADGGQFTSDGFNDCFSCRHAGRQRLARAAHGPRLRDPPGRGVGPRARPGASWCAGRRDRADRWRQQRRRRSGGGGDGPRQGGRARAHPGDRVGSSADECAGCRRARAGPRVSGRSIRRHRIPAGTGAGWSDGPRGAFRSGGQRRRGGRSAGRCGNGPRDRHHGGSARRRRRTRRGEVRRARTGGAGPPRSGRASDSARRRSHARR